MRTYGTTLVIDIWDKRQRIPNENWNSDVNFEFERNLFKT
jgi:hypothetical protein